MIGPSPKPSGRRKLDEEYPEGDASGRRSRAGVTGRADPVKGDARPDFQVRARERSAVTELCRAGVPDDEGRNRGEINLDSVALDELLDQIDDEQGPANYEEDNFEAGWHAAVQVVRARAVDVRGEYERLCAWLHEHALHPDYEYATTTGPRKAWEYSDVPPDGDGWARNLHRGHPGEGWERFEYHEESYWLRRRDG